MDGYSPLREKLRAAFPNEYDDTPVSYDAVVFDHGARVYVINTKFHIGENSVENLPHGTQLRSYLERNYTPTQPRNQYEIPEADADNVIALIRHGRTLLSTWGVSVYGNPCRECGFDWSISAGGAAALLADVPDRYARLLEGQDGSIRHPDLTWSVGAYVCHVGDNLRIYAERMWSAVEASPLRIEAYDQDDLASVRKYEHIPLDTALWSLSHSAGAWREAFEAAVGRDATFIHSERGPQTFSDLVQAAVHDAMHHEWDIRRALAAHEQA